MFISILVLMTKDLSFGLGKKQTVNIRMELFDSTQIFVSFQSPITIAVGLISKSLKNVIDKLWVVTSPCVTKHTRQ